MLKGKKAKEERETGQERKGKLTSDSRIRKEEEEEERNKCTNWTPGRFVSGYNFYIFDFRFLLFLWESDAGREEKI